MQVFSFLPTTLLVLGATAEWAPNPGQLPPYKDLACGRKLNTNVTDCEAAFNKSIPVNRYTTTQGGLHGIVGNCNVTFGRAKGRDIAKRALVPFGRAALWNCGYDDGTLNLKAGNVTILSLMGAEFHMSWNDVSQ